MSLPATLPSLLRPLSVPHGFPGFYLAVEGGNGTGKSTLARRLAEELTRATGREVVSVREPGGTILGMELRRILLDPAIAMDGTSALLLMSAARRALIQEEVVPALKRGAIVISDRTFLSTVVFQGAQGVSLEDILRVTAVATDGIVPDCTLVLTATRETAMARTAIRSGSVDRFEGDEFPQHEEYRSRYEQAAELFPRCVLVDGNHTPDAIFAEAWAALAPIVLAARTCADESTTRTAPLDSTAVRQGRVGVGNAAPAPVPQKLAR